MSAKIQTLENQAAKLSKETVIYELHIHGVSNTRKVDPEELLGKVGKALENLKAAGDYDWDSFHSKKQLVGLEFTKNIRSLDTSFKRWIESRAVPALWLAPGMFVLPLALVNDVETATQEYITQRAALVDTDIRAKYNAIVADAEKRLGPFFVRSEFPTKSELCADFEIKRRYLSLNVPAAISDINPELYKEARVEVAAEWKDALPQIRQALREGFQTLVNRMVERLTPDPDGERKRFHESLLNLFQDFISTFDARNLTDDAELTALVDASRKLLSGASAIEIRNNEAVRANLLTGFAKIKGRKFGKAKAA